MKQFAKISDI